MSTKPWREDNHHTVFWFVGVALALIVFLLINVAREQGWFEKHFTLQFHAPSADELRTGMQVRLFGLVIGNVHHLSLQDNGMVLVGLRVNEEYRRFLHADTQALLAREGMFGDSYILLVSDKSASTSLSDNTIIPFESSSSVGDLVLQLRERLFPILDELQQFTHQLNDPAGGLQSTLSEAKGLLKELRSTREQMNQTLKSADLLFGPKATGTLKNVDKTMADFSVLSNKLDQQFADISTKLQSTLDSYEKTGANTTAATAELNAMLKELRPELQKTLKDADQMILNANQTLNNMQTHWPFTPEK